MENQLHVKMVVTQSYFRQCVAEGSTACGLLPGQPKVLEYLATHPGCTPKDICIAWNSDKATLSGIISRMERDGLLTVSISSNDKRKKTLTITPKGKEIYDALQNIINTVNSKAVEGVSQYDMDIFLSVLDRISVNLKDFHPSESNIINKEIFENE